MLKTQAGNFVNFVASIDREAGKGKILYVNPSSVATRADVAGDAAKGVGPSQFDEFEIAILDFKGKELRRFRPTIQTSACEHDGPPTTAVIIEDIPMLDGMKRIDLLYKGTVVSHFEAGGSSASLIAAAGIAPMLIGAPLSNKPNRRQINAGALIAPEAGVSYTVQVKPENTQAWQTIAVGRNTPEAEIDRNQFPGVITAKVRVLRSTGFADEVFSEHDVKLNY
jgi:hypothetical protein